MANIPKDIVVNEHYLSNLCWLLSHNEEFYDTELALVEWMGTPEFAEAVNSSTAYIAPSWTHWTQNATYYFKKAFGDVSPEAAYEAALKLDHTTSEYAWATIVFLLIFPIIIVMFRVYSRVCVLRQKMRLDDWSMILAVICHVLVSVGYYLLIEYAGSGYHIWDLDAIEMQSTYPFANGVAIMFTLTLFFVKLSFLAFYRVLYSHYIFKKALMGVIAVLVILTLGTVGSTIMYGWHIGCGVETVKDSSHLPQSCQSIQDWTSSHRLNWFNNIFLVIGDFAVFGLSIPILWHAHHCLSRRETVTVMCLFALGLFAPVLGAIRTRESMKMLDDSDLSVAQVEVGLLMSAEVCIAVFCGSAPALKGLVLRHGKGWRGLGLIAPFMRSRNSLDVVELSIEIPKGSRDPMHLTTIEGTEDPERGTRVGGSVDLGSQEEEKMKDLSAGETLHVSVAGGINSTVVCATESRVGSRL